MASSSEIEAVDRKVNTRYELGQKLGKGAYGIVWKAVDRQSGEVVALKKIFDAFQNATDAQRTWREIIFLQQMAGHENIIRLQNLLKAENDKDIYLVFEFMETDLHAAIRANILEDVHKQYIMYQSFKALKYMHSAQLVHRDMKPANLLLNAECLMKVADFGLARSVIREKVGSEKDVEPHCTDYVATRWYRAPEILVGSSKYGVQVDMWSMGCIFAEMLGGKPVFTGTTTLNQIEKIVEVLEMPTRVEIESLGSPFADTLFDQIVASVQIDATAGGVAADGAKRAAEPAAAAARGEEQGDAQAAAPAGSGSPAATGGAGGAGGGSDGADATKAVAEDASAPNGASEQAAPPPEQQQGQGQQQTDPGTAAAAAQAPPPSAATKAGEGGGDAARQERVRARWKSRFPEASQDALELLYALMRFKPEDRLSSEDALLHAYCNVFHDPSAADPASNNVDTKGFPDNTKLQVKEYREALYKMVEESVAKNEQGMGGTSKRSHRHTPSRKESRRGV